MEENRTITVTPEEFKKLTDKLGKDANEQIANLFEKAQQGNAAAFKELNEQFAKIKEIEGKGIVEYAQSMQEQLNLIEKELKERKEFGATGMPIEMKMIKEMESRKDEMHKAYKTRGGAFEYKAAVDMSVTDSVGAGVIQPLFLPGIAPILKRRPAIWELLNKIPWQRDTVYYNQVASETGTPSFRKEDAASIGDATARATASKYAERSYVLENKSVTLQKMGVYSKITFEMMENIPDFVSWINNELLLDLLLTLDTKILTGTGTAPEFKGLQHSDNYTAASVPGSFTLPSGITPTNAQVLRAIITQMVNGYKNPTAILMHPTDLMEMDLAVDTTGQPLRFPYASNNNRSIDGVPIYENSTITQGYFHIIDGMSIQFYIQRALNIQIYDQVDDDPLMDRKTIVASIKGAPLVKSNNKIANIYGDFATLIAAMTAGS